MLGTELGQDRDQRLRLGLVALEQVHGQREPARVGQQAERDLRVDPTFLAHADLAQPVLARGLEVEGGDVVEHQSQATGSGRVPIAGSRDHRPVVLVDRPFQAAHERHSRRRGDPELAQHADGVELAGRLDDPSEYQRPERLVGDRGEPERVIEPRQGLPQDQRAGGLDDRRPGIGRLRRGHVQLQCVLVGVQPLCRCLHQQRQPILVVRGADVIDTDHPTTALVHDLHSRRARGRRHPAHERAHRRDPTRRPRPISNHNPSRNRRSTPYQGHDYTVVIQLRSDPRRTDRRGDLPRVASCSRPA
jgi:hypothetical protein